MKKVDKEKFHRCGNCGDKRWTQYGHPANKVFHCDRCGARATEEALLTPGLNLMELAHDNKRLIEENRRLTSERDYYRELLRETGRNLMMNECFELALVPTAAQAMAKLAGHTKSDLNTIHAQESKPLDVDYFPGEQHKKSYFYPKALNPGRTKTRVRKVRGDDWEV